MSQPAVDEHPDIPTQLEEWLEVATRRLSEDAGRRVRLEIAEHHREAVERRCREGLSQEAAQAAALEDLGCPETAGRAFRSVYLTRIQEKLVQGHRGRPDRGRLAIFGILLILGTIAALSRATGGFERIVGAALISGMAVSLAIIGLAAPALYRRGRARFAVMASVLADWLFYLSLIVGTALLRHEDLWMIALFAVTLVVLLVLYVPLLRKLTNDPDRSVHEVGSL